MDSIGNFLTSIRNAELARLQTVTVPTSKMKKSIAGILKDNGYVKEVSEAEGALSLTLLPTARHSYKRISKPGRRLYVRTGEIPLVLGGKGMVILSTSQGLLSGREARKRKLGGELICEVY